MPLAREDKQKMVGDLKEKMAIAKAVFVADYKGISVARLTELRRRLRGTNSAFVVAKNTLVRIAAKETGFEGLEGFLEGPVGLTFSYDDPIASAKVLVDFTRDFKVLEVKGGVYEGRALSAEQIKVLAELPPFEVLIAKVVGGVKAPLYGMVNVLSGPLRNLVYVLEAVRRKRAEAS